MNDVNPPKELVVEAENFEKKGLLKNALESYDFILHSYPQAISAHISKGLIFEYKRMYILSLDSYRLALQINPNDDFALKRVKEIPHKINYEEKYGFYLGCNVYQQRLIDMARLEMQYGMISKAKLLFRQTEQHGVPVPYARAIIKYIDITNDKLIVSQEIIKHKWIVERNVQIQEDFEDVSIFLWCNKDQARLLDLALQETDLENIEEAEYIYSKIIGMNDNVPYVCAMLAAIKLNLGNYEEALSLFNKTISLHPNSPNVIELRGECKEHLCRFSEACDDYNLAIKLKASLAKAHYRKGLLYQYEAEALGRKEFYYTAYECFKNACFYDKNHYSRYLTHFKRKVKYLKKMGLF